MHGIGGARHTRWEVVVVNGALICCPAAWKHWLPRGIEGFESGEALPERRWDLLVLMPAGLLSVQRVRCRIVLLGGGSPPELAAGLGAESVITYGLSQRDSLTLSSTRTPTLCVQRALSRPDGGTVEPQEIPLGSLPAPAETLLPLLGAWLLAGPQS